MVAENAECLSAVKWECSSTKMNYSSEAKSITSTHSEKVWSESIRHKTCMSLKFPLGPDFIYDLCLGSDVQRGVRSA